MRYNFTQLPNLLPYPPKYKAKLSTIHSEIISYVVDNYDGTFRYRRDVMKLLNTISYHILNDNSESLSNWDPSSPFDNLVEVDSDTCKASIKSLYLVDRDINWDISINLAEPNASVVSRPAIEGVDVATRVVGKPAIVGTDVITASTLSPVISLTPKSDLYIQPPAVPRFDTESVYAAGSLDGCVYTVYSSLPKIPTRQNEISVSTDVNRMLDSDLMKLYPNHFIATRSSVMYDPIDTLDYHEKLGNILPVEGFSKDELIDNLIKYPHIFKLMKVIDDKITSFYSTIEIDGELYNLSEVWSKLPESHKIPYNVDFLKAYVVRRYLLERDYRGIQHRYKMYGTLNPYLTLFMPASDYVELGHTDVVEIARSCVKSRVSYKLSRNPIIKRLKDV